MEHTNNSSNEQHQRRSMEPHAPHDEHEHRSRHNDSRHHDDDHHRSRHRHTDHNRSRHSHDRSESNGHRDNYSESLFFHPTNGEHFSDEMSQLEQHRMNISVDNYRLFKHRNPLQSILTETLRKPTNIKIDKINTRDIIRKLLLGRREPSLHLYVPPFDIMRNVPAKITFYKGTTNQAVKYHDRIGTPCAVLNFANSHHVGGGYMRGTFAQEEELMRTIPALFGCLQKISTRQTGQRQFVYNNFKWYESVKYSYGLHIVRHDYQQSLLRSVPPYSFFGSTAEKASNEAITVAVITAACPNLRRKNELDFFLTHKKRTYESIEKVIYGSCVTPMIANAYSKRNAGNVRVLIVGAIGCGAFAPSDPVLKNEYIKEIARIFYKVVNDEFVRKSYDEICFAIPPGENYEIFRQAFGRFAEDIDTQL